MDLPVKFPSDTEVILEDVARFRALAERAHPGHPRAFWLTGVPDENFAEGCLGQTVFRGAKAPRATEHPGFHRTPCTLTPTSCRTILYGPSNLWPRRSTPDRSAMR